MKIKFKSQPYQTAAVEAVVDCFEGQPNTDAVQSAISSNVGRKQMSARTCSGSAYSAGPVMN